MTDMIDDLNLERPFTFLDPANQDALLGADPSSEFNNEWDETFESADDDPVQSNDFGFHDDAFPATGVVAAYLGSVKDRLACEMSGNGTPLCYQSGTFWLFCNELS